MMGRFCLPQRPIFVGRPGLPPLRGTQRMNAPSLDFTGTGRGHSAFSWTGGRMIVLEMGEEDFYICCNVVA